jgi:hypothetical protein
MQTFITLVLSNFTISFLIVGLICALISMARARRPLSRETVSETLLFQYLFFGIGMTFLYNCIMHTVFGEMSARFIGWADSPFQREVGFASLGFAAVGFLAGWCGRDTRLAAILGPALFLWGAAGGHVYEMITAHNFAPGNAGVIFWTDIFVPVLGFVLLWLRYGSVFRAARATA